VSPEEPEMEGGYSATEQDGHHRHADFIDQPCRQEAAEELAAPE